MAGERELCDKADGDVCAAVVTKAMVWLGVERRCVLLTGSNVISQGGMKHTADVHAFLKDFYKRQ